MIDKKLTDEEIIKRCYCHPSSFNTIFYGDNETVVGNIYDNPELLRGDTE
ncbi:MAG: YopX family protein [Acutalibacteraceae bacterium]